MASLTEEQKRRIEENKKRALAIRAAKNSSPSISAPSTSITPSLPPAAPQKPVPSFQSNVKTSSGNTNQFFNKFKNGNSNSWKNQPSKLPIQKHNSSENLKEVPSSNFYPTPPPKPVTVTFSLISSDRFTVEFYFNKQIVELLKTVPSKLYDPKEARWSFLLKDYNVVKTLIQGIKEFTVIIKPLPNYILKVFSPKSTAKTDYKTIDVSRIHEALLSNLYPFQKEGVQFGISKNGRCIIADDMGLGKTIQALGIAHYYRSDWPLLVVCPSSMRYQWEQEIMTYLPDVPLTKVFVMANSKEQIDNPLVLITSYDLMSRCEAHLLTLKFGVIIMDESHSMKNMKTNRTKAALALIAKASRCILLSGTPALSRPMELYPQIRAIEPHAFSAKEFGLRYCDGKEGRFGWDFTGCSNMEELRVLLEERFMIRRLKSAVLSQLPSKIRQVVVLDEDLIKAESKKMKALAQKLNDETINGTERRGTLLSYYAETAKTKIKAIKDYVCQVLETGSKFLVFAHHKEVLDEICNLLEDKETYFIRIDGSVSSDARKSFCDQFQTEEKFRVAVLSITAASTGLTLTAANLVVFAELFWNPGILTQAEDRVHRIGQVDSVLVQYLIARGTADDHLWPLIKTKLDILNQAGLSKENFSCERTTVKTLNQPSITDFFSDMDDLDHDLSHVLDEVEGIENKRIKLNE